MAILEAGFGVRVGSGVDLEIKTSVSTIDMYENLIPWRTWSNGR
jgi:hypothetical protein